MRAPGRTSATTKKAIVSQLRQHEKYERLVAAAKKLPPLATAVPHPCDESSLRGVLEAGEAGLIAPILVGPQEKIRSLAISLRLNIEGIEIINVPHSQAAAEKAVELVRTGKAELLMKGNLHSDELLGAVTKREKEEDEEVEHCDCDVRDLLAHKKFEPCHRRWNALALCSTRV